MANTKQKQAPEGANRKPGKSRFSIPQKETPPIDGSYLDRLFADYEKQSQEQEASHSVAPIEESAATATEILSSTATESATTLPDKRVEETPPKALSVEPLSPVDAKTETVVAVEPPAFQPPDAPTPEITHPKAQAVPVEKIRSQRLVEFSGDDAVILEKLKKKHRLGKGEVKVLGAMLRMCRNAGVDYCFIKIPQLMSDSDLKERQTQLVLRSLRELGLIEKIAEYSNVDRLGTQYRLNLD